MLDSIRRILPGVPTSEHTGDPGPEEGSASLQEARRGGELAGSGESRAGWYDPDQGVAQVRAIAPVDNPTHVAVDLEPVPRDGGRPQRFVLAMPAPVAEYADGPPLSGQHNEIINRPHVFILPTDDRMMPWANTPPTQYREVPAPDAGNPPPCQCGGCQ